jgi:23S rRNA pseudouridine2605 synthase
MPKINNRKNPNKIRLNKYIADSGVCSRRKADKLIAAGEVKVNKKTVTELGTIVNRSDFITVSGNPVNPEKRFVYIVLNKPKDFISTVSDEKGRKTVMDIVKSRYRIFPVGRLDRNTTGVLLFTNDGELAKRLMHPSYEIIRSYRAGLDKPLLPEHAQKIASGLDLDDFSSSPCEIILDYKDKNSLIISLKEGKNREVRRLFEIFGYNVKKLERKAYGNITNRGMKRGEYRHLTIPELKNLKKLTGLL